MPGYDVSLPVSNNMALPAGGNDIQARDTNQGDSDSVYRFNLCSHTGTYIETAGHNQRPIEPCDLSISAFIQQPCDLLWVQPDTRCITLVPSKQPLQACTTSRRA